MQSAVGRLDGHNVYLGQVLVMGTHNGPRFAVIRFAKEKLESLSMINSHFLCKILVKDPICLNDLLRLN